MGRTDRDRATVDLDRAAGALVGLAAGDALGAGYEFTRPGPEAPIGMVGGGAIGWPPGHWTDDTDQAVAIARVTAAGATDPSALDLHAIGQGFLDWMARGPRDVGISTGAVLRDAGTPERLAEAAARYFMANPRGAAGNGSLMRTSPVALAFLGDDEAIATASRAVSDLTHGDPLAADGCVLWGIAIDRAVREGRLDGLREGLPLIPAARRDEWARWIDQAEQQPPATFTRNGFVVTALQAAWAAITQTPVPADEPCRHLQDALVAAVRIGDDTDTVAAIAGQLLGARWGASAVPWRYRRLLHGTDPTDGVRLDVDDLVERAVLTVRGGRPDALGWPSAAVIGAPGEPQTWCAPLAGDEDLLVGNLPGLAVALEQGVDAVVSLCRVGREQVPEGVEHHAVRLVDRPGAANAHPRFVIADAAEAVETLRAEGKRVYLHCVGGRSRTAAVATAILARRDGLTPAEALPVIRRSLPEAHHDVFGPVLPT